VAPADWAALGRAEDSLAQKGTLAPAVSALPLSPRRIFRSTSTPGRH